MSNVFASLQRGLLLDALGETSWLDKPLHHVKVGFIEGAARVIYHKDRYTHASPLLNYMKALNLFKLNISSIPCFMYKCMQNSNPPVFCNIFTHRAKTKYAFRNENSIQERLCRTQYYNSHSGPNLWNKIVTSKKLTFSDSDSLKAFKCEIKRFLLSVELNDLEILK